MNLSDDVRFLYTFHSKFTIYVDFEHLSLEAEFNTCDTITVMCAFQVGSKFHT